ncbi:MULTISPECIES: tripartite tricarboxylate transporter permease [unclassified Chelatococcus]|uniref:tripartite tricarboxylate transporter permease n=1 Tax=unclassified Chelatococcus TaxID=2638111 RepID=UPI001BD039E9|nr:MULTISPECIES: tripartite tricarboxylate transporter permease [unclassified Chelatococcus]MBS7699954.1 tripartite tricarboxylate transporter permease [Chelatococcus sp. YT9]MBX3558621.1 tripartite tricarboxylate transporter permease [Chelatococcus sp.]
MSDILSNLALGFSIALTPVNIGFCFLGALLGTLIGVLPGIGPLATVAMLLPITFYLDPTTALIMLAGIYYGAQYGGSTTSILVNMPGESSSVVTCLDGYQMARQGRAGAALAVAALASMVAGTIATFVIVAFTPPLTAIAESFQPAEYCSLMLFGLIAAVVLAQGSLLKAIAMVVMGLLLGIVGTDINSGERRFTFNLIDLADGIEFVALAMGLFGIREVMVNLESKSAVVRTEAIGTLWPTRDDFKRSWKPALRGTALGSLLGVLPGGGALLSSFASYTIEKKLSKTPRRFGRGAVEGVAGPEAANNAGAQTSFIPLLTLGIPGNALIAMMAGALMIHGIQPGPEVVRNQPQLFWGLIASMWLGNLMLLVINLPLIGIWVRLLKVPYRLMFPAILMFCVIGVYGVNNASFEVLVMAFFGVVGYILTKINCEPAPLILGFILGPLFEENLRRTLLLSRGDWSVFVTRPTSLVFLILAALLLAMIISPMIRAKREEAFQEE